MIFMDNTVFKTDFLIIDYFRNGRCKRTQEEEGNAKI